MKDPILCLIVGSIPVAVIFIAINVILDNINGAENIHMISWVTYFSICLFLMVTVQLAVTVNYMLLCYEEYRWWWKIWTYSASTGFFSFLVMLNYFLWDLKVDSIQTMIIYWVGCTMVCVVVGLMTSAACITVTFQFNLFIYSNIKSD